ncbi:hypothetical protein GY45DRAFT_1315885 [Cubamyces sp. BRFM 1775]|nr:hypothetical protein GY45DRAFT_1315885 [Cubamyces sp. BRFM 1775]
MPMQSPAESPPLPDPSRARSTQMAIAPAVKACQCPCPPSMRFTCLLRPLTA